MCIKRNKKTVFLLSLYFLTIVSVLSFYTVNVGNTIIYLFKYVTFLLFIAVLLFRSRIVITNIKFIHIIVLIVLSLSCILNIFNIEERFILSSILYTLVAIGIGVSTLIIFSTIKYNDYITFINSTLIVITGFVLMISLYDALDSSNYYSIGERERFTGSFSNANELARFLMLGIMLSLKVFPLIQRKFFQVLLLLIIISSFYIIILTDSRSALLISSLAIFFSLINFFYFKINKYVFLFVVLISVALLGLIVVPEFSLHLNKLSYNQLNLLSSGRLNNWMDIFTKGITTELIFGSGAEREGLAGTAVITNGYFEIIEYLGLFGLLVWLLFILVLLNKKIKATKKNPTFSGLQGISIVILFMFYYVFEGGLLSIGNIASIYFWIELVYKDGKIENVPVTRIKRVKLFSDS